MELLAVSKNTIRAHVIGYFHDVFGTPLSAFKPDTNVRSAYSYSDRAWRQLANVFNKLSWMRELGVLLSPRAMPGLNTIDDIVNAIWGGLNKVISVPGSGVRMEIGAIRKFASPKRGMRGKAKASARSGPRRKKKTSG